MRHKIELCAIVKCLMQFGSTTELDHKPEDMQVQSSHRSLFSAASISLFFFWCPSVHIALRAAVDERQDINVAGISKRPAHVGRGSNKALQVLAHSMLFTSLTPKTILLHSLASSQRPELAWNSKPMKTLLKGWEHFGQKPLQKDGDI